MDDNQEANPFTPRKPTGRPKGKKESREAQQRRKRRKALTLLAQGQPVRVAAAASGLCQETVRRYRADLARVFQELEHVDEFRTNKADIIDAALCRVLKESVNPAKLEKATLSNIAYTARQLDDMNRREKGLSTENIAVFHRTPLDQLPKG